MKNLLREYRVLILIVLVGFAGIWILAVQSEKQTKKLTPYSASGPAIKAIHEANAKLDTALALLKDIKSTMPQTKEE